MSARILIRCNDAIHFICLIKKYQRQLKHQEQRVMSNELLPYHVSHVTDAYPDIRLARWGITFY